MTADARRHVRRRAASQRHAVVASASAVMSALCLSHAATGLGWPISRQVRCFQDCGRRRVTECALVSLRTLVCALVLTFVGRALRI